MARHRKPTTFVSYQDRPAVRTLAAVGVAMTMLITIVTAISISTGPEADADVPMVLTALTPGSILPAVPTGPSEPRARPRDTWTPTPPTTATQPIPTTAPKVAAPPTATKQIQVPKVTPTLPTTTKKAVPLAPKAAPPAKESTAGSNPLCNSIGLKENARKACLQITANNPGITNVLGRAQREGNPTSCHPLGLAVDFMVPKDSAIGNSLNAYVRSHKAELTAEWIGWQVPDHHDHVHVSFSPCLH